MNISGILVKTLPENLDKLVENLKKCEICDYHYHDENGKVIVTIEGDGVNEEIKKLVELQKMEYVLSADMVYSYSEDELNEAMEKVQNSDGVPEILTRNVNSAKEILYGGDINNYFDDRAR